MPTELKRSRIKRAAKAKKMGARAKHRRENKGTTASFPLEGDLPALRFGVPVDPATIVVPADLLKSAQT